MTSAWNSKTIQGNLINEEVLRDYLCAIKVDDDSQIVIKFKGPSIKSIFKRLRGMLIELLTTQKICRGSFRFENILLQSATDSV